jgi:rubrerythrin
VSTPPQQMPVEEAKAKATPTPAPAPAAAALAAAAAAPAADAADEEEEESDDSTWRCVLCTYANEKQQKKCAMCGNKKYVYVTIRSSSASY